MWWSREVNFGKLAFGQELKRTGHQEETIAVKAHSAGQEAGAV